MLFSCQNLLAIRSPQINMSKSKPNGFFRKFSQKISQIVGAPATFFLALSIVVVWAVTGPLFHFSDTWQLVINTGTTIITFLMVFLIQNTQNRDAKAMQLKLDELIRAVSDARNKLANVEEETDEEIAKLSKESKHLHQRLDQS
jgi:low affinity Fe/Cu permease